MKKHVVFLFLSVVIIFSFCTGCGSIAYDILYDYSDSRDHSDDFNKTPLLIKDRESYETYMKKRDNFLKKEQNPATIVKMDEP